jgi:FkbM family methyltransferase
MVLRHVAPHGLVRLIRRWRRYVRFGLRPAEAFRSMLNAAASADFRSTRLDLLPPGSRSLLQYVVDVGANEGAWSAGLLRFVRPKRLIAVEPAPAMGPSLHGRLASFPCVSILPVAAGERRESLPFNVAAHPHNSSILMPRAAMNELYTCTGYDVVGTVMVPVEPLDALLSDLPEVSLLKIDVQGFERQVILGAEATLSRTKLLLIEANFEQHYDGGVLFPEMHDLLVSRGFYLHRLAEPFSARGRLLWTDALYVGRTFIPPGPM